MFDKKLYEKVVERCKVIAKRKGIWFEEEHASIAYDLIVELGCGVKDFDSVEIR